MNVFISGASGFIGGHLTSQFLQRGDNVTVVIRPSSQLELPGNPPLEKLATFVYDGTTESMIKAMSFMEHDLVFHLASLFKAEHRSEDVADLISGNLLFGTQLVEAMAATRTAKLINTGTSWQHYLDEKYNPTCLYAASKQAFESLLRYYAECEGLSVTTLKLFDTYGPFDKRAKLLALLLKVAREQTPIDMSPGDQLISLVYVDDVVDAFMMAGTRLLNEQDSGMNEYAIAAENPVSLRELVETVSRVLGLPISVNWGGRPYRNREVMVPWAGGNSLEGWHPKVALAEGIERVIAADV